MVRKMMKSAEFNASVRNPRRGLIDDYIVGTVSRERLEQHRISKKSTLSERGKWKTFLRRS